MFLLSARDNISTNPVKILVYYLSPKVYYTSFEVAILHQNLNNIYEGTGTQHHEKYLLLIVFVSISFIDYSFIYAWCTKVNHF